MTWITRHNSPRGFTLIELMVTVVVLSIAAMVVIPSMAQTGILRVQSVARTIVADIAFAQSDAMAYQRRRLMWFGRTPSGKVDGAWTFAAGNGYVIAEVTGPTFDLATSFLYSPDAPSQPLARNFDLDKNVQVTLSAQFGIGDEVENQWLIFGELGGTVAELTGPQPGPGGIITIESELITYEVDVEALTGRATVTAID